MQQYDRKLQQISVRIPHSLTLNYDDLKSEDGCKRLFEFCLPYPHDHDWWSDMHRINLQINMNHLLRFMTAHYPQLEKLAKVAKHKIIAGMSRSMVEVEHDDGFVFREESFVKVFPAARKLMAEHCVEVGESPDYFERTMNVPLMEQLEEVNCLQVVTARCNGRLFGYIVTILGPSLEFRDAAVATQTAFYVDPKVRGLGMRLQRAAVEILREKGVREAFFRAGVRADGPRSSVVFRRIGAAPFGEWFKLQL